MRVGIIGAGWTGATVARLMSDAGHRVDVYEKAPVVGGHARVETLGGVTYEPNGAHIFHTSNPAVYDFVARFGMTRPYEHCVVTEVFPDPGSDESMLLSWPPQVDELRDLPSWPAIEAELAALPDQPVGDDFDTFVRSMMGDTLYELFIRGYTEKQWGCDPTTLSSSFAPKRVELRRDGYRRLFRDTWELFPAEGVNSVIEAVVAAAVVHHGAEMSVADAADLDAAHDALVVTAALDDFAGCSGELAWRGVEMQSELHQLEDPSATLTPAYVVNQPSLRVPYTRTVETKHATGQSIDATVVSREMPGAPRRHYPVPTVEAVHERRNEQLAAEIRARFSIPVMFAGRLATYRYINQDQAIESAMAVVEELVGDR